MEEEATAQWRKENRGLYRGGDGTPWEYGTPARASRASRASASSVSRPAVCLEHVEYFTKKFDARAATHRGPGPKAKKWLEERAWFVRNWVAWMQPCRQTLTKVHEETLGSSHRVANALKDLERMDAAISNREA